jgi:hypothetical protein
VLQGVSSSLLDLSFKDSHLALQDQEGFLINDGTLTLTNSIVSGNTNALSSNGFGGGITNAGALTLINSMVSGNRAGQSGGGIENTRSLTLINSRVSDNAALGSGGGISNGYSGATVTLINSTVSDNTTSGNGGGIANDGRLTLTNSTVVGNTASVGGGIENESSLTLINSTISDNKAFDTIPQTGVGGGISNIVAGRLTLINSTISGNVASSNGGGIDNVSTQADISFCTIYGNTTTGGSGGGIAIENDPNSLQPSHVKMSNTLVANNHATAGPDIWGTLITSGYNLISNFSGITFNNPQRRHATDLLGSQFPNVGIDPMLRNNGGPAQTHALLPGSPAIDAIPLQYCQVKSIYNSQSRMYTDQRGMKRPDDGNEQYCDIGAYESP